MFPQLTQRSVLQTKNNRLWLIEPMNTTVNIITLTTESSPAMKERGKAVGVEGWIVKPFKGDVVLETFRKLAS